MKRTLFFWLALPALHAATPATRPTEFRLTLAKADADRAAQAIAFPFPANAPQPAALRDAAGKLLAVQLEASGNATFFLPLQKAGEAPVFTLLAAPSPPAEAVQMTKEAGRLRAAVDGKPALFYQMDPEPLPNDRVNSKFLRGAFIHPIFSPAGRLVSDSYPLDHYHHHGIWTAWENTEFQGRHPDFWNMSQPNGGTVDFVSLDRTWNGTVSGGFESHQRYVDRLVTPNVPALDETWKLTLYAAPETKARVFDLALTHKPMGDPVNLLEYRYGGLGVRGSIEWLDKANLNILTSEGITDRVKSDAQRARWYCFGGKVAGELAGIAILDAPDNPRAPQPVRMNPAQPFFCYAPVQLGPFTISAEKPYSARYRFVIFDGPPDAKFLEACWQGFAHPATVTIETP